FIFVLLTGCGRDKNPTGYDNFDDEYILFETLHNTHGECLNGDCGFLYIDFGGYRFDKETKTLHVSTYLDSSFKTTDSFKLIFALEQSLSGDAGCGKTGGVAAVERFPYSKGLGAYPLAIGDSLTITGVNVLGVVFIDFKDEKITLSPNSTRTWSDQGIYETELGKFLLTDLFTFKNYGFCKKENIKLPY
ncbi:MAG: hypothetical protein ACE5NG_11350, partial [bacterium]